MLSTNGASCRSAFKSRTMPLPFSAEPSSTGTIRPSRRSLTRSENTLSRARLHVGKQLLHQLVVVVGELLQHREARLRLALLDGSRHLDHLGLRVRAVDEGPLEREVDEARGDAVLPDRDLAQHQRTRARGLQGRQDVAHLRVEGIDLVEEQEARDAAVLELLQDQLQRGHPLGIGLAHHHGRVAARERERALVLELDGAGAVDEGEVVAEEADVGDVDLDAHAVVASLAGGITDRILVGHLALARHGAGAGEDGFQEVSSCRKDKAQPVRCSGSCGRLGPRIAP